LEFITKLASSPHILQHLNAAKYGFSEGRGVAFSNATPRFFMLQPLCRTFFSPTQAGSRKIYISPLYKRAQV